MTTQGRVTARWMHWWWWICYPPTALVVLRLIYEQTVLTRTSGLQMVGFSLVHQWGGLLLVFGLCILAMHVWLVVVAAMWVSRRRDVQAWMAVMTALALGLLHLPYGAWQRLQVSVLGPGTHAAELLVEAAAQDNQGLISDLLARGVGIDERASDGDTAVKAAATAGHADLVRYLLSRNANPNIVGGILSRTALMNAAEMGHRDVVQALLTAGADTQLKDVQGRTAAQIADGGGRADIARAIRARSR